MSNFLYGIVATLVAIAFAALFAGYHETDQGSDEEAAIGWSILLLTIAIVLGVLAHLTGGSK